MRTIDEPPRSDRRRSLAWVARATQVRLRFLAALTVAALVVGRWDVLRTYWDHWTAPMARDPAMGAVSADTEYFCPMDPGVRSAWPGKCPICHMATVRRSRGDMGPLPIGVVARVQFSPDRVLLGGIRSEPVRYRPLSREVRSVGAVMVQGGRVTIRAEVNADEASWLEPDQPAEAVPDPPDGSAPAIGWVRSVGSAAGGSLFALVEVADPSPALRLARWSSVAIRPPMAGREPFRSLPRGEPPLRSGEPRSLWTCPDHPDVLRAEPGHCQQDEKTLDRSSLGANQRLAWWCPMHPRVVADRAGRACDDCGGMPLVVRMVTYSPVGEVLAVPESAVIDTGLRTVVYVERMPGAFDGVEVRLGPRCGGYYPVVEGLEVGQAVASAGAFLVDAETRLNPSVAAAYFGAHRRDAPEIHSAAPPTCPVTGKRLGSMGPPVRIVVNGRTVFLCCAGCEASIRKAPEKYLTKGQAASDPAPHP